MSASSRSRRTCCGCGQRKAWSLRGFGVHKCKHKVECRKCPKCGALSKERHIGRAEGIKKAIQIINVVGRHWALHNRSIAADAARELIQRLREL